MRTVQASPDCIVWLLQGQLDAFFPMLFTLSVSFPVFERLVMFYDGKPWNNYFFQLPHFAFYNILFIKKQNNVILRRNS